jgi:acyl-CoA synthetase (AMP-forming)/AMP-acid ligase II
VHLALIPEYRAHPLAGPRKAGTVGVVLAELDIRVVDDDDRPLPPGGIGEIVVRGPVVMRGYLGRPEDTRRSLRGGWPHTGDFGRFDDDGICRSSIARRT